MDIDTELIYQYIGGQLRRRRSELGLTQAQIAQRIGVERTSISNIEAGRQKLPIHALYQLCHLFDVEVNQILPPLAAVTVPEENSEGVAVDGFEGKIPPKAASLVRELHRRLEGE
jgi:transcriptional regulator with XRE-family HTH domain